ncbi:MAG: FG-GAP-like repeat-containing protein [Desulfuromonadales bacterium]|nr:FG-GAP-like repeat-containing protein [Desulfuromonadales bacterium]
MKKSGIPAVLPAIMIASLILLWACGGGGGGGGGISPSIHYSGVETAAVITDENAESLAVGAYLGIAYSGQTGDITPLSLADQSTLPGEPSLKSVLLFSRIWEETALEYLTREPPESPVILASVSIDEPMAGDCRGYADVSGSVNDQTGDFDLDVTYHDYSDDCVVEMSGRTNMQGNMDLFGLSMTHVKITYEALAVSFDGLYLTQSGVWSGDFQQYPPVMTFDLVTRDEITGKTYWMRDVEMQSSPVSGTSDTEYQVTGRYYDPDVGYVDLTTLEPLRFRFGEDYPYQGRAKLAGSGSTAALVEFVSNAVYRVTCDEDGDGLYDDYDSGIVHWPGENNIPTADAGPDQEVVVDCVVSLAGSTASDVDGDPLVFYWQLTSLPLGSQTVLSGENTSNPSFTPDLVGDYVVELTSYDGIDISPADFLTIEVIGGDFCAVEHIETGSRPEAVAMGDVNSDGDIEVVMTTSSGYPPDNDHSLLVFSKNGSGLVSTPSVYPAGDGYGLAIGDVNNDGRNDVVVTVESGIGVFYQNPLGQLGPMATISAGHPGNPISRGVVVGDVSNDGRPDISYLAVVDNLLTVAVFTQKTDGTLNLPASYQLGYGSMTDILALGDVDGKLGTDIVVSSGSGSYGSPPEDLNILYQNGSGTMDPVVHIDVGALNERPSGLAVGDMSGDTRADIALQFWYPSSTMTILYQDLSGLLASSVSFATPFSSGLVETALQVQDIDQDGRNDLIGIYENNWSSGAYGYTGPTVALSFQQNDGSLGTFSTTSPSITGRPYNPYGLAIGDIDDDGKLDIVFTNPRITTGEPGVPGITIFSMGKW